ncbi:hypothetical protein Tco_1089490 [Tanacetum coccineum]
MKSKDMVSSYLDKNEQELQRLKKEMKNNFDNIFHHFQICIHGLRSDWFHQNGEYAFRFLFGAEFQSFKNIFDNNIDHLKEQLEKEELHEYDSKTCLAVLKKQFEPFFDLKSSLSSSYQYQPKVALQKKIFQEYAHYTPQSLKETILSYLNSIKKLIDERACHEEELRITEKDVKDKHEKIEMEKQETMIQKSECSSPGDNLDAKREKQEMEENCRKTFQELKKVVSVLNPRTEAGMVYMVKDKCDDGLVVKAKRGTKFEMKDECSKSGNDTQAEGPDIRLSNDTKPLHEVQSTVVYNMNANDRQYAEQPKFINEGKVDQDAEQCLENKTTESLNQTLVSENDCLKKTIAKLQNDFSKLEAQRIAFEIALQHKKEDSSPSSTNEHEKELGENICDNAKCEFQTKFVELEKVVTQQTKDFDECKLNCRT